MIWARRKVHVHEVRVLLGGDADEAAIGGAVTQALCGRWDHRPPCYFPHSTTITDRRDAEAVARVLYVALGPGVDEVRRMIDVRMADGRITGPDGRISTWSHLHSTPGRPNRDEVEIARKWEPA